MKTFKYSLKFLNLQKMKSFSLPYKKTQNDIKHT